MSFFDKMKKEVSDKLDWRKIKVIAGDLHACEWDFNGGMLTPDPASGRDDCVALMSEIESLEIQTQDSVKDLAKTLGLTVAGGALFGLPGAIAGYFVSGNRKEVCVLVKLKDGRKFLAAVDQRIYQQMIALSLM